VAGVQAGAAGAAGKQEKRKGDTNGFHGG